MQDDRYKPLNPQSSSVLLLKAGALRCALPLSCVSETLRPLPLHALANTPGFVCGASVIRGEPVPVVDLARFLGAAAQTAARFVLVRAGKGKVALAVEAVIGIQQLVLEPGASVPPLLAHASPDAVGALAILDRELLLVLQTAHIVPEDLWPLPALSERSA
jgi:purine-binding chemotaxis protein CheW